MYEYGEIRTVHLELTEHCNAACPQCPRRIDGGVINPQLTGAELTLAAVQQMLPADFVAQLKKIFFCGNYGDPAAAAEALQIARYLRSLAPALTLGIHSNGSLRSTDWWRQLAGVIGQHGYARFAIDGLKDTNHIYRRQTNWEKIMANARAFIDAGGRAEWDFIVFEHNEHQVEAAEQLATNLGFSRFNVKRTARFINRKNPAASGASAVKDRSGATAGTLAQPRNAAYRNNDVVEILEKASTLESYDDYLSERSISCKVQNEKSIYIAATGNLLPCCWIGAMLRNPSSDETRQFRGLFPDVAAQTLLNTGREIKQILAEKLFQADIPTRWESGTNDRLKVCARACGK
jgi:MoaA/NifB/PqqE/SkfB family radical SAM enzyme